MINTTDRAEVNTDNYQFYFNKLLTLNNIKIQNDVLSKETVKAHGIKSILTISGILASSFMIYNCIKPDTTVRTAAQVTAHAIHMINRTGTLFNYFWGEASAEPHESSPPSYQEYEQDRASSLYCNNHQLEEYIDEETEALNEKGKAGLKDL